MHGGVGSLEADAASVGVSEADAGGIAAFDAVTEGTDELETEADVDELTPGVGARA